MDSDHNPIGIHAGFGWIAFEFRPNRARIPIRLWPEFGTISTAIVGNIDGRPKSDRIPIGIQPRFGRVALAVTPRVHQRPRPGIMSIAGATAR